MLLFYFDIGDGSWDRTWDLLNKRGWFWDWTQYLLNTGQVAYVKHSHVRVFARRSKVLPLLSVWTYVQGSSSAVRQKLYSPDMSPWEWHCNCSDSASLPVGRDGRVRTGFIWLTMGTSGRHLLTRQWASGFHRMTGVSWVAQESSAFQGHSCMDVTWAYRTHSVVSFVLCNVYENTDSPPFTKICTTKLRSDELSAGNTIGLCHPNINSIRNPFRAKENMC